MIEIDTDSIEISFLSQLANGPLLPKKVHEVSQNPICFTAKNKEYEFLVENNVWFSLKVMKNQ